MYGNKLLPPKLDGKGPKGQIIPNQSINLEYYVTKEQFQDLMYSDKKTLKDIAKEVEYPYDVANLSRIVRKLGWKKEKGKVNQNQVDLSVFKSWSKESAWLLGWIVTDGYICKRYFELTLQIQDEDVINKVKNILKFSGNLYKRETKTTLRIYNRELVKDIVNLGVPIKNKTFECVFPSVPNEYKWDFIRGVFEGDGSLEDINKFNAIICGASYSFISSINAFLNENGIETHLKEKSRTDTPFYVISTRGMENALRMCYFMYNESQSDIRMARKFNKVVNYVTTFYTKKRKVRGAVQYVELMLKTKTFNNLDKAS